MDTGTKRIWVRRAISAFLLFHLFGIFTTPNPYSLLTQSATGIYRPYMNLLGLSHSFGFFAPEPISPPLYIDYSLEIKDAMEISGRFPDEKDPFFFRERYNRLMSMSHFVAATDGNIKNMLVHYLCQKNPHMVSGKLWRAIGSQATLEMVRSGERKVTDPVEFKIDVLGTYYCPEGR